MRALEGLKMAIEYQQTVWLELLLEKCSRNQFALDVLLKLNSRP